MDWIIQFFKNIFGGNFKLDSDYENTHQAAGEGKSIFGLPNLQSLIQALVARLTGAELTGAQREANEFNAAEAQKSRDFTEFMTRNKYQMETQSMESAGLNPAMVYGGGQLVPTATNGAQGTSSAPSDASLFDVLPVISRLPKELKVLDSEAERNKKEGDAALINARAAERNAGSNEFNAETNRMRQEVDAFLAKYDVEVKEAQRDNLAANTVYLNKTTSQLDDRLEVLKKQVDAQQKQAIAALQSSLAALRQAAVSEKLSDSEIELRKSQVLVNWAASEGQSIVNQHLDEKTISEIKELNSRSGMMDENAKTLKGERKVQWMRTITGYTDAACKIVETGLGVATGMPSNTHIGF